MRPHRLYWFILAILISGLFELFVVPRKSQASPPPINNLNDDGYGSLRYAVNNAVNGDVLDATNISGNITLTSGQILITHNIIINGPGPALLTIDGFLNDRIFTIQNSVVSISGFTLTNGKVFNQLL